MDVKDKSMEARLDFIKRVALLCYEYQLSVTSWFRSSARNHKVGGSSNSWHLHGFAVDVVTDQWPEIPQGLLAAITKAELHYLVEGSHLHIQAFGRFARAAQVDS